MSESDDHLGHHRKLRERRAWHATLAGIAFQGVYAVSQFVIMAVLVRHLDPQRFGMWLTIYSLTAWAAFTKFGLQHAMYTALGDSALTHRQTARQVLTAAAGFVVMTGSALTLVMAVGGWWLPWARILNVTEPAAVREAGMVSVATMTIAIFSMPMMMGGHAMQASQRGAITQSISLLMQLVMIGVVLLGVTLDWPLVALAVVIMCPPLVSGVMQWIVGITTEILPRPTVAAFDAGVMRRLLSAGVLFMALDVATIGLLQSGPIIVAHLRSPEQVVPYSAAYRLIGLLIAAFMMINYAYWPAYSEAARRQDIHWIRHGLKRVLLLMITLWAAGSLLILLMGRPFVGWWLGAEAVPSWGTLWAAVAASLSYGLYLAVCTVLSGLGHLRPQIVTAILAVGIYAVLGAGLCAVYGPMGLFVGQAVATLTGAGLNLGFLRSVLSRFHEDVSIT